ncbi:MAG: dynamin family protein [Bacteroidaceae bacterium]|nr:dynamin family protein [Bacteroidaceae bacterium]
MKVKEFNQKVNECHKELRGLLNRVQTDYPELINSVLKDSIEEVDKEISRNELGLVRVLFLGASSSGKSTMINGIARKIVVPEVMHTSTLLPTWIGLSEDETKHRAEVLYRETNEKGVAFGEMKPLFVDYDSFRCKYCYTREDVADRNRLLSSKRFKGKELHEAYMCVPDANGIMSNYALTLVDTLGHGVSHVDDEKAKQNMKNCDMAIILLDDSAKMTTEDLDFFASTLFNPRESRIDSKHILFVINKIDRCQSQGQALEICKNNIKNILQKAYGGKVPEGLYEKLCRQIIPYSALYVRMALNGFYPYKADALRINGWIENEYERAAEDSMIGKERRIVNELIKSDKKLSYIPREDLLEEGCYEIMGKSIGVMVKELIEDGTIHKNHFADIERVSQSVVDNVKEVIKSFEASKEAIDLKISRFKACENDINNLTKKLSCDAQLLIKSFPSEVNGYIKTNAEQLFQQAVADTNEMINNLSFNVNPDDFTRRELRNMTLQQIEELFMPSFMKPLNDIIAKMIKAFCDGVLTTSIVDGSIKNSPSDEFRNKYSQLLCNYIDNVQLEIKKLNEGDLFKVTPIDKAHFTKKIEASLNQSQLTLIVGIQNSIGGTINAGLAEELQKPLKGFWQSIKNMFKSPVAIIKDMEEIGRNAIRSHINYTVAEKALSGNFLTNEATADIVGLLDKAESDCEKMVIGYLAVISNELETLKRDLAQRQTKLEKYRIYQKRMNDDLKAIVNKLETIKKDVEDNGIEIGLTT